MTDQVKVKKLLDFIDASPSPWHAVATMEQALIAASFTHLSEQQPWQLETGGRYYVVRDGSSIIAFVAGGKSLPENGIRLSVRIPTRLA